MHELPPGGPAWRKATTSAFIGLTRDLSNKDWGVLLNLQEWSKSLYVFDDERRTATRVSDLQSSSAVPWPVLWLLTSHSRRHVFVPRALPKKDKLMKGVQDFCNRLRWRWHFKFEADPDRPEATFRVSRKQVPTCLTVVPHQLEEWCGRLRSAVSTAATASLEAARFSCAPYHYSNSPPLLKFSRRLLDDAGFRAALSDKDGGFCLEPRDFASSGIISALSSDKYEEVSPYVLRDQIIETFSRIARRIGKATGDKALPGVLLTDVGSRGVCGLASPLSHTVKTHKAVANTPSST